MIRFALMYLNAGLCIIPGNPKTKKPLVKWAEFQQRKPTVDEVKKWWTKWPKATILLVTGAISGVVVVDVDTPRSGEIDRFVSSRVAQSPNGWHYYYEHPGHYVKTQVNALGEGIDVKGDGGYVICPPSQVDGRQYRWHSQGAFSAPPAELLEQKVTEGPKNEPGWAEKLLREGAQEGERNVSMTKLAGYLLKKGNPASMVITMLDGWSGLGIDEVEAAVRSLTGAEERKAVAVTTHVEVKAPSAKFAIRSYDDYMGEHCMTETSWLIDQWLMRDTIGFLVAPPGSYKTWVEFDMAVSIAGGHPFLDGIKPNCQGPVLMIQQEDFPGQIVDRIATIQCARQGCKPPKFYTDLRDGQRKVDLSVAEFPGSMPLYFHEDAKLKLDDPQICEEFEKAIDKIRPKLCVIDPLYSALSKDEYMVKGADAMLWLKELRTRYGCTFLLAHHTAKAAATLKRTRAWGSVFLDAALESGYQQLKIAENKILVARHMKGEEALPTVLIEYTINTKIGWQYDVTTKTLTQEEVDTYIAEYNAVAKGKAPGADHEQRVRDSLNGHKKTINQIAGDTGISPTDVVQALGSMGMKATKGYYGQ